MHFSNMGCNISTDIGRVKPKGSSSYDPNLTPHSFVKIGKKKLNDRTSLLLNLELKLKL
jgi:hypothetical protein